MIRIKFYIIVITFSFLISCANQLPPGGGKIDTIPPEVISIYPANGTTNFNDDHLEIEFSEYVDKRSVQEAVFISPAIEGTLEYDWNGTSVEIKFPEKLQKDITYIVTIGTEAEDLNNRNKMAEAVSIAFSTGDKIDHGIIEGKIFNDKPQGIMVYAYPLSDTLNPTKQKPKYISQAGLKGEYRLLGLAFDNYRVFAVKDASQDLLYNIGDDDYGSPYMSAAITEEDTVFHSLNFVLTKEDTLKPKLVNAVMTDKYHALVEFSENIDSTLINSKNFLIVDSSAGKEFKPLYAFKGKSKEKEIVLSFNQTLNIEDNVFLKALEIIDKTGNKTENDYTRITVSDKPDTSAPNLIAPKSLPSENPLQQSYLFSFDDGFDSTAAKKNISIKDKSGKLIRFSLSFLDDASFKITPLQELVTKQAYFVNIDLNNVADAAGNKRDSIYKYEFTPRSKLDFTGVSGTIEASGKEENVKIILQGVDGDKMKYQKTAKDKFNFDKVNPGKYLLWSFTDKDSSNSFTYGKPFPFIPSERFTFYPDTLNLRARWPVEDVKIRFP